jgi:hypothetical protein
VVLDDDTGRRLFRPIKRHDRNGNPIDISAEMVRLIIDTVNASPSDWGPKRIRETIRRQRHDVSEDAVRNVMNALRTSDLPY